MRKNSYNLAVAGATGAVGSEILRILEEREFPVAGLKPLASERSRGREITFRGERIPVETLREDSFKGIDLAIFSAGSSSSRRYAPLAVQSGAVVIDNSSAFRMEPDVPLVVPEINLHTLSRYSKRGIVANPNCTTVIALMALKPLYDLARITRVVLTSFQSVSGAGAEAMEELGSQTRAWSEGKPLQSRVFPYQIAFNLIPHIDSFLENGYTREEMKLHHESRKILEDDSLMVTATTVRVPVFRAHSISINAEMVKPVSPKEAREAFEAFSGLAVVDEPQVSKYPLPIDAAGVDNCLVGRIREDFTRANSLSFWVVGDQLRKGAALNAVQIAEALTEHYV